MSLESRMRLRLRSSFYDWDCYDYPSSHQGEEENNRKKEERKKKNKIMLEVVGVYLNCTRTVLCLYQERGSFMPCFSRILHD